MSDRRSIGLAARRVAVESLESRSYFAGVGAGLVGEYFADAALTNLGAARTDSTVNFTWPAAPATGIPANNFSVRWTGMVLAQFTQTYTFYASTAGGVRVWINGTKIIDNWTKHTLVENKATVALTAGKYYPIQVEYREDGTGSAKLSWSSASTPKAVIPQSQLYRQGTAVAAGGWLEGNIGTGTGKVVGAGTTTFNVTGGGSAAGAVGGPIGGTTDNLHFLYRSVRGDAVIVAKVAQPGSLATEAGLVIRNGTGNKAAFAGITYSADGLRFESRLSDNGSAKASNVVASTGAKWLKLVRDGNAYAGYVSPTGVDGSWTLVGTGGADIGTFGLFGLGVGSSMAGGVADNFATVSLKPVNPLGGNLTSESDRVQDLPFTDLVKTTRGFYNLAGRLGSNGVLDFATSDANGWPTEDFSFKSIDNTEWNVPVDTGTYKMQYVGPAGVSVTGSANVTVTQLSYDPATNLHTCDVVVGAGALKLTLTFTNTQGAVKNIRLLQPGYDFATAPTFTSKYINLLKTTGPSVIRFMDWVKTNGKQDVNWSDRPKVTDATQAKAVVPGDLQPGKGIAWEYCVELANILGRDVWVNVPAHATDDYVTQLATLLKNSLKPDINIYVEYSNEVWNDGFEQAGYNKTAAVQEVIANPNSVLNYDHKPVDTSKPNATNPQANTWGDRRHARRTKQISDIFRSVWTSAGKEDPINRRVRVILGGQVAVLSRFDNELAFLNTNYGSPKNYLYGLGVAPYFGLNKYASSTTATKAQVLEGMNLSIDSYVNGTTLSTAFTQANSFGLKLVAYEGGPDTFGANSIAAKRDASLDPAMQGIIVRYLNNWYTKGGELFNWFTIAGRSYNSPYGTWAITEDTDILTSSKIKGFLQVRDSYPVSTGVKGVFA